MGCPAEAEGGPGISLGQQELPEPAPELARRACQAGGQAGGPGTGTPAGGASAGAGVTPRSHCPAGPSDIALGSHLRPSLSSAVKGTECSAGFLRSHRVVLGGRQRALGDVTTRQ